MFASRRFRRRPVKTLRIWDGWSVLGRRTVMRLTYDLHHLFKRLEKYRKNYFGPGDAPPPRADRVPLEAVADIPEPPAMEEGEDTDA